uniref:Corticotropin releasing hormone n=1 Tax=Podarcis muralis TaxID=64176 RepID=A0A670IGV4_PODMU
MHKRQTSLEKILPLGSLDKCVLLKRRWCAAVQQLQNVRERSLEGAAEPWPSDDDSGAPLDAAAKEKRSSKDSPISIDLTFHLLRQLLEMARAEQLSQQVESNRKMLETIGK